MSVTPDKETGAPLIRPEPKKTVVIDNPKLVADLRGLEEARGRSEKAAREIGYQLVMLVGTAAAVGQAAYMDDKRWLAELMKVAELYGVKPDQLAGTDLDSKEGPVITLK